MLISIARDTLYSHNANTQYAEDAVQDAFVRVAEYIEKIPRSNESAIKAYLSTMVRNAAHDHINSKDPLLSAVEEVPEDLSSEEDLLEQLNIMERYDEVVCAIRKLNEPSRSTLEFYYLYGFSVEEIGAMTGKVPSTVYSRLSRGLTNLLKLLGRDKSGKLVKSE